MKPPATQNALENAVEFRQTICTWFQGEGKDHPWRQTTDPWAILISEVMLQQTTVAAVRAGRRFERFLEEFPDIQTMAQASEEAILKAWEGLGYYNRVRSLQKIAHSVIASEEGTFPTQAEGLQKLPGVGPYTAGAIASFAFNEPAAIVDGNIARVLARIFHYQEEIDSSQGQRQLWQWARELLDHKHPRVYNSGLMEIGQVYCSAKNPDCLGCPLAGFCQTDEPETLPRKRPKRKPVQIREDALVAIHRGQILLVKEAGNRRKGFYRLPLRTEEEVADLTPDQTSKYAITHHRVTLNLYRCSQPVLGRQRPDEEWIALSSLAKLPMVSPIRKALARLVE